MIRIKRLFRFPTLTRDRAKREVDDELEFHLSIVAAQLVAEGWSPPDAHAEARRRFGDVEYTREYCYREDTLRAGEMLRMTFIDELGQDLQYAFRNLRRAPGFTAVALLTLALGIGATTAVFSVVRGVLLSPLPFAASDRLVRVWPANKAISVERGSLSEPDFLEWRSQSKVAQSMSGFFYGDGLMGMDLTGDGPPERIGTALVTDDFFQTLRPRPLLGRMLQPADQLPGSNRVIVLGHGLWTRRFNADPKIIGRTIQLSAEPFTVVGVMPAGFSYPADNTLDGWVPLSYAGPNSIGRGRGARFLSVVARLQPGATAENLRAELATIAARNAQTYPEDKDWTAATVAPIRESIVGEVRRPLTVLFGAVSLLLLITCVNIASLLLARASARQGELGVRAALGAGRGRIVRQLLTESIVLSSLGGAVGIALAYAGVIALRNGGVQVPGLSAVRIDGWMLGFAVLAAIACGILFGLLPAMRASGSSLQLTLRADTRGVIGAGGNRLRSGLVLAEVALAVMLVVGAGLAAKSFARLIAIDPGFKPGNALVTVMSIGASHSATREERATYYYRVLGAIAAVPGVKAVGAVRDLPTRGTGEVGRVSVSGLTSADGPETQFHQISTGYFTAMGIPLKAGRFFGMSDNATAPLVMIINEELARRLWPGETSIVGKTIPFGPTLVPVVGVVGNIRQRGYAEPAEPAIYLHVLQSQRSRMSIVARTQGDPLAVAGAVRRAIWSVDQAQTITETTTLSDLVGKSVSRQRMLAWLLGLFGLIGLVLGSLGIYGVLAFTVAQRRKEIGVRVALGASPQSVMRLIVGRGVALAAAGIVVGVVGARLLSYSMQTVLFEIQPNDLTTMIQVVGVLMGAALLASWLPARRALRIDPISALRAD